MQEGESCCRRIVVLRICRLHIFSMFTLVDVAAAIAFCHSFVFSLKRGEKPGNERVWQARTRSSTLILLPLARSTLCPPSPSSSCLSCLFGERRTVKESTRPSSSVRRRPRPLHPRSTSTFLTPPIERLVSESSSSASRTFPKEIHIHPAWTGAKGIARSMRR